MRLGVKTNAKVEFAFDDSQRYLAFGWGRWTAFFSVSESQSHRLQFEKISKGLYNIYLLMMPSYKVHRSIFYLCATPLVTLLLFEVTLRVYPRCMGQEFANGVRNKYHAGREGIYYAGGVPAMSLSLMKPNFRAQMYYNGYTWEHRTDSHGFRNNKERQTADIMLIGDSFVYGHGLEAEDTIAFQLEKMVGRSVSNLGRQSDSIAQVNLIFNLYFEMFKPRHVFYFYTRNDIEGLYFSVPEKEIITFIETAPENIAYLTKPAFTAVDNNESDNHPRLYISRVLDFLKFLKNVKANRLRLSNPTYDDRNENSIGWQYAKKALLQMHKMTQAKGATFIVAPFLTPKNKDMAEQYEILHSLCKQKRIGFLDLSEIMENSRNFLPRDGHPNKNGALEVARLVASFLAYPSSVARVPADSFATPTIASDYFSAVQGGFFTLPIVKNGSNG